MISPVRTTVALLCLAASLASAQYTRIEAPVGPGGSEVTLHLYLFDPRRTTIKVISQGEPGTQAYRSLDAAMRAQKCEAGCNGGSLDGQGNPLGLVIADGKRYGKPAAGAGPTAGVFYLDGSQPRLQRAAAFFSNGATQPRQLLQAGPFLVEGGKAVSGLNPRRAARRTFVLTDGNNRWAIGYSPPTTLQKLALTLGNSKTFPDFKVVTALNLSSASSSGIWLHRKYGPLYLKEIRPGRSFVGLLRR